MRPALITWSALFLGKRMPSDRAGDNPYTRAAGFLGDWRPRRCSWHRIPNPRYIFILSALPLRARKPRWNAGASLAWDIWRTIRLKSSSATSRPWPSPRPTAWTCCAPLGAHFGQIFMLYSDPAGEIEALLPASAQAIWKPATSMAYCTEYGRFPIPKSSSWFAAKCATRSSSSPTATTAMKPL